MADEPTTASLLASMARQFGVDALKRPISAKEVYGIVDIVTEKCRQMQARIDALEGQGLSFEGTHQRGKAYRRGHAVVHDGSLWVATTDTKAAPGRSADWQLAAKAGRDGR